jgi:hypothetical protein
MPQACGEVVVRVVDCAIVRLLWESWIGVLSEVVIAVKSHRSKKVVIVVKSHQIEEFNSALGRTVNEGIEQPVLAVPASEVAPR